MDANTWQVLYFPFDVSKLRCEISGIRGSIPERAVLFCIRTSGRLDGMFWSEALQCNFVYVPSAGEQPGPTVSFEVVASTPWSSAEVSLQSWGTRAPAISELAEDITVTAGGVIGEERRDYRVSYEWPLVADGAS